MLEEMNNKYQNIKYNESKKAKANQIEKKKDKMIVEQSDKAIELIMYNKINTKNAFDVNVEFVENITNIINKNEETAWQKVSASLDASAKIYGFRVDSVHSETFKFLGGLSRNDKQNDNDDDQEGGDNGEGNEKKDRDRRLQGKHEGYSTLEKDPKKLNLNKYDLEFDVDPLFRSMTAKFNETGARGLLLNNLPLDNNLDLLLESKEEELKDNDLAKCSNNKNDITEENMKIIQDFVSNMTVMELTSMQIAPDLGYFKKTRELESALEKTFYNNFMNELEAEEDDMNNLNETVMFPEINNMGDNLSVTSQNRSEMDSAMSQQVDDNGLMDHDINLAGNLQNLNNSNGYMGEGFSLFKHDDILNHEGQFGDGSREILKNLPQFQNFTTAFNQLDKNNLFRKPGLKDNKRIKREEKLFEFTNENIISRSEIFGKESKKPNLIATSVAMKKEKKKKVKQFYNFDKYSVYRLFTVPNKQIIKEASHHNLPNLSNRVEGRENILNPNEVGLSFNNDDIGEQMIDNSNMIVNNQTNVNSTFIKFDQDYEKRFGNLYKKFDIRLLKSQLWDSYEKIDVNPQEKKKEVEFQSVVNTMTNSLSKNEIGNISTATCFVCLLHLCNEKNLEIKQNDDSTFYIEQPRH